MYGFERNKSDMIFYPDDYYYMRPLTERLQGARLHR
jgi:hypothetical protein